MASGIPTPSEYNEYYQVYVGLVDSPDILDFVKKSTDQALGFYRTIPSSSWDHKYAPGKWSIKGVLQHVLDTERIFAYRMLRVSRGDSTPLMGFDQNAYADDLDLNHRSAEDLITELAAVRQSTIAMMQGMVSPDWEKMGSASDSPISVRALGYLIAGHEIHHQQILKEKYLG